MELTKLKKAELIELVEKLQDKAAKSKGNEDLLQKIADLEEENRLLAIQQDDDEVVDVTTPITTPKTKTKKLSEMDEFELAEHMRLTTSIKQL